MAAAAATLTWVLASYAHRGKVSVIGAAAGAVAGLVAITPASGYVTAGGALLIGAGAGGLCYAATLLRERVRVDDALDVFAVHGVGGMFGAVATGVLAVAAIGGASGAIQGNFAQIGLQLVAVGATVVFAAVGTLHHRQGRRLRSWPAGRAGGGSSWASTWLSTARSPISHESDASTATSA